MSPDDQSPSGDGRGEKGMAPGKPVHAGQGPPKALATPVSPPPKPADAGTSAKPPGPSASK